MNLKGGYKILILPVLSLVSVETSITDKEVLEQLKGLLTYSGKKELKPILIHCGIEESSKVTKHCVMGELKKISDTEYVIIAKIDKAYLTISVEFTLDSETEEYYIASGDAKYLLTKSTSIDGDLVIDGDLTVDGVTSKGIANTGGIANIGDVAISGDLDVSGEGKGVITCNSLIQKPRYVFDFDMPNIVSLTKVSQWFCKIVVLGNSLHIIGNARYRNETDSTKSAKLEAFYLTIPEDIGALIIDEDGKPLTEVQTEGANQIRAGYIANTYNTGLCNALRVAHTAKNRLQIVEDTSVNLQSGSDIVKGFHIELLLIPISEE